MNNNLTWDVYLRPKNELEKAMDLAEDYLRTIYGQELIREGDVVFLNEFHAWRGYPGFDLNLLVKQWNLLKEV